MHIVAPGFGGERKTPEGFSRYPTLYRALASVVVSLASLSLATIVRMGLDPYLGNNQAYATYYVAVALMAWLLGSWPALVTMALGYVAGDWFFVPPRHSLGIEDPAHLVDLCLYLLVAGTVIALIAWLRHIQESLRQSELRFRVTAETVPDVLLSADLDGQCDYVSKRFYDYTGFPAGEALGYGWTGALHPDDSTRVRTKWQACVRMGQSFEAEYRLRGANGAYRWFVGRVQPIEDGSHRIIRWVGCCTDIEAQKHAAELLKEEVDKRTAELQQTVQELEGFSYSLAHDMRAPLRAIVSYIELAELELRNSAAAESLEHLRRTKVSARRMDSLIVDAFSYTAVLRGQLPIRTVEVAALLHGIIESYPGLQPPAAEVVIQFSSLRVRGNESALTQVFSNLLGNAVKFVAPGVHPRVQIRAETGHRSDTFPQPEADWARIWVEDNGIGIPQTGQEKIFGMFERLHHVEEYAGTGIGLAIVKKAMERMGGRVGVESEVNQGSRFWIELPFASDG